MVKRKIVFRQKKKENRLGMMMVSIVVLMIMIVVAVKCVTLSQTQKGYTARINQLNEQITEETQRAAEIEEYGKYTRTKKYAEEVAKDKLGLVYEDEIIFKAEE